MAIFKATVELFLDVENDAEACDGVAEMLRDHIRELGAEQSCLIDWHYSRSHSHPVPATQAEISELEYA